MKIEKYKPQNALLTQHIAYFYFLTSDDPNFSLSYRTFPHFNTPLSILKNVKVERKNQRIIVSGADNGCIHIEAANMFRQPLHLNYKGKINEVTVVFKPFGFNQFVRKFTGDFLAAQTQPFDFFEMTPTSLLEKLFAASPVEERAELLEKLLLRQYVPVENEAITTATKLFMNFDQRLTLLQTANMCGTSDKTLNRLFHQYLATSPRNFRKVAQFRHSISNKVSNPHLSFAEISCHSNYYDQAYLIKTYRHLTGETPSAFFQKTSLIDDKEILWALF